LSYTPRTRHEQTPKRRTASFGASFLN